MDSVLSRNLSLWFFTSLLSLGLGAQDELYSTLSYSDDLQMDYYKGEGTNSPLVLFVHGGGFHQGSRDHPMNQGFSEFLQEQGVPNTSITYTLGLKGIGSGCNVTAAKKKEAIQLCVADIWKATNYILDHKEDFSFNGEIVLAGSSAGAEGALHAAFWDSDDLSVKHESLQDGFKYSGVISMAGAILDTGLITIDNMIPVFFAHGSCDKLVPYMSHNHRFCDDVDEGAMMFHGAGSIAKRLDSIGGVYMLITECGSGHEVANTGMIDRANYVDRFLDLAVNKGVFMQQKHTFTGAEPCDLDPEICKPQQGNK